MIPARTRVALLLTLRFGQPIPEDPEPLSVREWGQLARWLVAHRLAPEHLVEHDPVSTLAGWDLPRIDRQRLFALLDREQALAAATERWLATGLWVIGRSDAAYPQRLKSRLGASAPPALFGYGAAHALQSGGIAIVGMRDASAANLRSAMDLGDRACRAGHAVISGGARGVDQHAAEGAFRAGGLVVVVVGDSLLETARSRQYVRRLDTGRLTLLSPFAPDAAFSAGNAMSRNRLIYCLSDAAIAVCAADGSGGTFGGASEALRRGWVPVWAVDDGDPRSGNHRLVAQGARWLPAPEALEMDDLFHPATPSAPMSDPVQTTLLDAV